MEKKYYQIVTKTAEDWSVVHELLIQDGTLEDNIPDRSVECENEILHSPTRSTYLMTDEEAEILRNNPHIECINLDPEYHEGVMIQEKPNIFRYDRNVRNYRSLANISGNATISSLSSPTSAEFYRTGYQILRCAQRSNLWPDDASTVLYQNVEYNYDGTDVDVIVCDNGVFFGHPEFTYDEYTPPNYVRGNVLSRSGTCGVLDLVLDAPYYLDPEWFESGTVSPLIETTYNGYPVRGYLYNPTSSSVGSSVDVVVLYHGTIEAPGVSPFNAASTFMNIALNEINIRDKLIFSVAYPQDMIPAWQSDSSLPAAQFPGLNYPTLYFGDNIVYAEAALLWVKNNLNSYMSSNGISKTVNRVFTFGHSQGAYLVHRLNTMHPVNGVIANAPGPIDLLDRCSGTQNTTNFTCNKIRVGFGLTTANPAAYNTRSLKSYLSGTLSPTLFTQALNDDPYQVNLMQNTVQVGLNACTSCSTRTFNYYPTGGHDAFVRNTDLQRDIRNFIGSSTSSGSPTARLERRWDGTLVPKEDVARQWWSGPSFRSPSFPNFGSIFIPNFYTRAKHCGANRTTPPSNAAGGGHGTPCAAQAYGKNHGWAFNANKWSICIQLSGGSDGLGSPTIFNITKIFHLYKPNNPKFGTKNPTVSSNSWGSSSAIPDEAGYWSYQGEPENLAVTKVDIVGQPAFRLNQVPFLKTIRGVDFEYYYPTSVPWLTAGKEMIDSGVIFVVAGGNSSRYLASPGDPNFNNYYRESFFSFDSLLSRDQARTSATNSTPVTLYPFANTTINSTFFANNPSDSNLGSDNFTRRFGVTPINLSTSSGSSGSGTYTWSYIIPAGSPTGPQGIVPGRTYRIKAKADDRANISIKDKNQSLIYSLDFGFGTSGSIRQRDEIFTIPSSSAGGESTITITYTQGGGGSIASGNLSYCAFVITEYGDITYTNRPGWPAQIGYTVGDSSYKSFVIGAIDDRYTNHSGATEKNPTYLAAGSTKEKLASNSYASPAAFSDYSTRGTGIDFYAPGDGTLSASSSLSVSSSYYQNPYQLSGMSGRYNDDSFNGTSSACPTAAGLIAGALQNNRGLSALNLKTYLKNNIGNQTNFFTGIAPTSAKDPNWHEVPYNTMGTPVKIIHEITTTSSTPNPSFTPQYGILSSSSVNERFTITHSASNRNTLNIYGVSTVAGVIAPFSSSIPNGTPITLEIRNGYYLVGSNNRVSATASGGPATDSDGTQFGRLDEIAIRVDPTNNKRVQLSDSNGRDSWDDMEITVLNGTFQKVGTQIYYVFSGITSPISPTAPTSTTTSTSGAASIVTAPTITSRTPGAIVSTGGGLSVSGAISAGGNIFAFVSDERLKGNQKCIKNALDKVEKLNGFTYNFNETGEKLGFDPDKRHSGVSAQDVQEVLPEAVAPAPADNNYLTVKYDKLIPLLIESIKDLKNDIDDLKDNHNK